MDKSYSKLAYLFNRYKEGTCSAQERKELMELIRLPEMETAVKELIGQDITHFDHNPFEIGKEQDPKRAREILSKIISPAAKIRELPFTRPELKRKWWPAAAAAAAVLLIAMAYLPSLQKDGSDKKETIPTSVAKMDIPPGKNGAILTLGNGTKILLDSVKNGVIASQGGSHIVKENGQLSYQSASETGTIVYNTITTPRGRVYPDLVLADGSKVTLDAGSSIRFPSSFTGAERKVEITGQVWFDIAHEKTPFKVIAKSTEIEDLGTEFNIKAYDNQPGLKVTLLRGAVKVRSSVLKPGQQAEIQASSMLFSYPNLEEVMAWKDNYFSFNNAGIKTLMEELSRWYDIDVVYEGTISQERFSGKIGRNLSLRDLLDGLSQTKVHYRIEEGRRLVVLP